VNLRRLEDTDLSLLLRELKMGEKLDAAVEIDVARDVILDRLTTRRTCAGCGEIYNVKSNPPAVEPALQSSS
jgi:adenylate kinase